MDLDHDGKIDLPELKSWIKNVFEKMLDDDVEAQWKDIVKDDRDKIDLHSYLQSGRDKHRTSLQKVEQRRWTAADLDKDNLLNRTELFRFLHPEEFKDMKPVLAQESLDELDKNGDGTVDIDEYMKDLFPAGREFKEKWIRHERQNFGISRDLNKDGALDRDEIQNWLLPETYDRVEAEAEHIMDKTGAGDTNVLTKNEILEKYYIFVGSRQDGPYGEYLNHEDL